MKISTYIFSRIVINNINNVVTLQPKDFKILNKEILLGVQFIANILTIITKDYEKFFSKLWKKLVFLE